DTDVPDKTRSLATIVSEGRGRAAPRYAAEPEGVAFLQLSGGTTVLPKLIPRTHDDYLYSVRESARICDLDAGSVMLVPLPAPHNFAMSSPGILGVIHARGTVVLTADQSAGTVFGLIASEGVTIVPAVPSMVHAWLGAPELKDADLS